MRRATVLLIALTSCSGEGSSTPEPKPTEELRKLAGVYPERFACDSIASTDELASVLGGSVRQLDTPSSVPRGLPRPCNYEVTSQPLEYWTFDFDCRDNMKQTADRLFAQYTRTSAELVAQYNAASDAGPEAGAAVEPKAPRNPDAGPEPIRRAPEDATEVQVGARGLDHHGQGLLFIDDDAPCYVRIVGPDSARRLALAQLVAHKLTFANAPMTPRPFP